MSSGFKITENNKDAILDGLLQAKEIIHEKIGIDAEKYAKALCPVGTPESTGKKGYRGSTLRNSITHKSDDEKVVIGSDVEYAPYVELGTGPYFQPPPEWEEFDSPKGSGDGHSYVHPRPYLKPAIMDHLSDFAKIIETTLK